MQLECPNCSSRHAERLVLTWAKGLSHQKSTTISIGAIIENFVEGAKRLFIGTLAIGFWPIGLPWMLITFLKPMIAISRTWGTSQTMLSAEAKPPFRFKFFKYLIVGIVLAALSMVAMATGPEFLKLVGVKIAPKTPEQAAIRMLIVGGIVLSLVCLGLFVGLFHNRVVWPALEARWQRSFRCGQCGTIYIAPDFDPVGVNKVVSYGRIGKGELLPRTHTTEQVKAIEAKAFDFDERHLRKRNGSWKLFGRNTERKGGFNA